MTSKATSPEDYIKEAPEERQPYLNQLRATINNNLPDDFLECMQYGMISYVVPHNIYPNGYHCSPETPLPFMSFASQKNSINLYHSGIYTIPEIHDWFVIEYPKYSKRKLDMGKSCIRFKKPEEIPYKLIAELCQKLSVNDWINTYEKVLKK
jgi:hypothetical protein